jgi:hypothetical protein
MGHQLKPLLLCLLVGVFFMDLSNAVGINVFTSMSMMQPAMPAAGQ